MRSEKVKAIIIGVGTTGVTCAEYLLDHNAEIVGAVDICPSLVGRRLSDLIERANADIIITDNLETCLNSAADIALICTASFVEDIFDIAKMCLAHGINVITTAEKAFFPWYNNNIELIQELDMIAKKNGVTMYASGVQDILWVNFATMLSGLFNEIKRIHGINYAIIDEFGPACLEEAFVGKKKSDFATAEPTNDDFNFALYAIAENLNLNIICEKMIIEPIIATKDVYSEVADVHVKCGDIVGVLTKTEMNTKEGIVLSADFYEKIREEGDSEKNYWRIESNPTIELTTDEMYGGYTTCTTIVNRVPDVINAAPGYITPVSMPIPRFKSKSLEYYIK